MEDVADALEAAQEEIFITDWWWVHAPHCHYEHTGSGYGCKLNAAVFDLPNISISISILQQDDKFVYTRWSLITRIWTPDKLELTKVSANYVIVVVLKLVKNIAIYI